MLRRTLLALSGLFVATMALADHTKPTTFQVTVKDVSTPLTLKLSNGMTAPAPVSPGLWVVHTDENPLYRLGAKDLGLGLEALAEDGNPEPLEKSMRARSDVRSSGVFNTAVGDDKPGPLLPGKTFVFTVEARPGDKLSFAEMFGQSNDLFYAPEAQGIALFDKSGKPVRGSITARLVLLDAGTEVNQEPGLGADQGPRQKSWDSGEAENGIVRPVKDSFSYPATAAVIEVTLSPVQDSASK